MNTPRLTSALFLAALATSIQAETINCTPITSVPATITTQGIYCLTGNLNTSQTTGNAITINVPNVTLDLNGWKLGLQSADTGTAVIGIFSNAHNVTIKNGIVRGFYQGIYLTGSGGVVQDVLADTNYYIGIYLAGPGALAEHNQVVNTGAGASYSAFGIAITGTGSTASDNIVSGVTPASGYQETGIDVQGSGSTVRNNVVSNTAVPSSGESLGILSFTNAIVLNNTVTTFTIGIYNISGGIYAYNTADGCTTAFSGGTAGAGNSND